MHGSDGALVGLCERRPIDPETRWIRSDQIVRALVTVNVPGDLIGALPRDVDSRQHVVGARQDVKWASALKLHDTGHSPIAGKHIQPAIREFRGIDEARHVHDVTSIFSRGRSTRRRFAIPAVTGSCGRDVKANASAAAIQQSIRRVSDAVRPGVIGVERESTAEALFRAQQQTAVASSAAVIPGVEERYLRSLRWIDRAQ